MCVYGVPPAPVYKGVEEGERAGPYGAPWRSPTPTGSRIPPLPCSRSRRQGRGRGKRRKEGAPPLPLVQFGLVNGGARGLPLPRFPVTPRYLRKYPNHSEPLRCPNIVVQYIDLYVSTISRLLVMSPISSGTPNSFGTSKLIN